jgi:molybdopterin-guanine dinucleotide biosynthesis protein A
MVRLDATDVTGLILAGGRGTRMGGADKGWIDFDGRPLVEHVLARLRPQVAQVIVSANRNVERYRSLGCTVVEDDPGFGSFAGPLAGLLAGLRAARTDWLVAVPCDAPMLPLQLVARLRDQRGTARGAVAVAAGRFQPTFCLLATELRDDLAAALARGEHKAESWLRAVGAAPVAFDDDAGFVNLNRPEQVRRAGG